MAAPANARIVYENTVLPQKGKAGKLLPDESGYYTLNLGGLGIDNSAGEHYLNSPVSRATFSPNSTLIRRVTSGALYGELSHPNPADYPNQMAFLARVRQIQEDRIACHIRRVWLEERVVNGRMTLVIMGEVKPMGKLGQLFKDALETPDANVSLSGRFMSNVSRRGGQIVREPHTCITWDVVIEGGIPIANKYDSPSLESRNDTVIYLDQVRRAMEEENQLLATGVSLESNLYRAADLYVDLVRGKEDAPAAWKGW